ncbi:hypothetical protein H6P81_010981 [Aristolochia fimbriata]|uniref:Uncharacterized protein n=1 Tax=Aristolochia fimbriata TaxID=158543 RepID=A0AAV7ET36_ARIFI|nr:hypothetical protein H6P81_010981 [Aristolochia fimbriata]
MVETPLGVGTTDEAVEKELHLKGVGTNLVCELRQGVQRITFLLDANKLMSSPHPPSILELL